MSKSTMVELVDELEKVRALKPASSKEHIVIGMMIDLARRGEYHDYKNNLYVCGKVAAVDHCRAIGLNELADRIAGGEFDETPDAEDEKMIAETLKELVGGKTRD